MSPSALRAAARDPLADRLTHQRRGRQGSGGTQRRTERTCPVQTTLAQSTRRSRGRLRTAELEAAEGLARPGHDPGQARLDGRLPGRGRFEHAGSGGIGRMLKKAVTRRGRVADEGDRHGRGLPRRHGAGHPPDLPRERHDHGQRAEPARVRRGHRLGHQARPGRRGRDGRRPLQHGASRDGLGGDPLRRPARAAQRRPRRRPSPTRRPRSRGRRA